MPYPLRIFLASPGDVPRERKLTRETIEFIARIHRFREYFDIETIAWEAVALEAGLTPQEAIIRGLPKPEDCDLAIIILWKRIGTPLPADFELKEDGTPYFSGTEWECCNAIKGFNSIRKKPSAVWIYRRNEVPQFAANDPELKEKLQQWERLEIFFANFNNSDGSIKSGINVYESPDDYQRQFEQHLVNFLENLLESQPQIVASGSDPETAQEPLWPGSPYPGLNAFTPEQGAIFFGRGREIDQLLQQFSDPKTKFIAVVGVSGSGKSSLVKAGLVPHLRIGTVGYAPWLDLMFKPGERGGNPFMALAFALKSELKIDAQTEKEIARKIEGDHRIAAALLTEWLSLHNPRTEILLVIDQFEELFTQCTPDNRHNFIKLLDHLVNLPRIRSIVTLRADFFGHAINEPLLAGLLRQDRGTFPLEPPGIGALHEMITRPAQVAGIELEEGLPQRLLDDVSGPGSMPLIAFTLNQLYQQNHNRILSLAAYKDFGGVKGAIQKRANSALQDLNVDLNTLLPKLFANLVEVNEQEVATRRRARQSVFVNDVKKISDALIEARLLASTEGEDKQPSIEVAHETVLSGWDRLQQWILSHAGALRARRDLEQIANEWSKSGRPLGALHPLGSFYKRYNNAAEPRSQVANDYLAACKRLRKYIAVYIVTFALIGLILAGVLFHVTKSAYPPVFATKALFVQIGLLPLPKPIMIAIPAGEYQMGDQSGQQYPNETPVHTVKFTKPFELGKYEVTFRDYDLFAAATGRLKPNDQGWGRDDRPVINITWLDAKAYTEWLANITGAPYRLPAEAEWEYAARAGSNEEAYWSKPHEGLPYSACNYANLLDIKNAATIKNVYPGVNFKPYDCEDDYAFTAPVGKFLPNRWGLYDMLGNVWEWTQDCYDLKNNKASEEGKAENKPESHKNCSRFVMRGGSWRGPKIVRFSVRPQLTKKYHNNHIGLRLAKTP